MEYLIRGQSADMDHDRCWTHEYIVRTGGQKLTTCHQLPLLGLNFPTPIRYPIEALYNTPSARTRYRKTAAMRQRFRCLWSLVAPQVRVFCAGLVPRPCGLDHLLSAGVQARRHEGLNHKVGHDCPRLKEWSKTTIHTY